MILPCRHNLGFKAMWGPMRSTVFAILAAVAAVLPDLAHGGETYSFGVVPQFERRRLFEIWKPITDEVSRRSGVELTLTTTMTVSEFEHQLGLGSFDFVFTNPYHILKERNGQGYIPLVRHQEPLRGIVVVAKDSPYHSVQELDGKSLAVPSPNALGASILIRADLERLFGVHVTLLNAKSHTSVYLHVANGLVDAGGGVQKVFDEQKPEVRDGLRVIYTTRAMPSHPVAAHPRVPAAVREAVRAAFLAYAATPEGATALSSVPMRPLVSAAMSDYLPMTGWNLEGYWQDEGTKP